MTTMNFSEARRHFSELLDQVVKGKTVLITRRGKPAAVLGPPPAAAEPDVKQVVKEMLEYRDRQNRDALMLTANELIRFLSLKPLPHEGG
ncbi:MAG: type II toxin-antitoxin system Phd/YefM family antitoxin [Gemmataceae bacterium]